MLQATPASASPRHVITTLILGGGALFAPSVMAENWQYCTWEGGTCTVSGTKNVRFGDAATNRFVYKNDVTGSIACTSVAFGGDPAYGVHKSCYADADSGVVDTWTYCTSEGGTCTFSGTQDVRYGDAATNRFLYKDALTGSTVCSNAAFGGDPAYGVPKACYTKPSSASPPSSVLARQEGLGYTTPVGSTANWVQCAAENAACRPSASTGDAAEIRFGDAATGRFIYGVTSLAGTGCIASSFGNVDPAPGAAKACWFNGALQTLRPVENPPAYSVTQMFGLANRAVTVKAGDDVAFKLQFYGVPGQFSGGGDAAKVAGLLTDGAGKIVAALDTSHWGWLPAGRSSFAGYKDWVYTLNIPQATVPGTYNVNMQMYQGVPPYAPYIDLIQCGTTVYIAMGSGSYKYCKVGTITVQPYTQYRQVTTAQHGTLYGSVLWQHNDDGSWGDIGSSGYLLYGWEFGPAGSGAYYSNMSSVWKK
jgi:hypothetical protein